jgi:hypothetical protein
MAATPTKMHVGVAAMSITKPNPQSRQVMEGGEEWE